MTVDQNKPFFETAINKLASDIRRESDKQDINTAYAAERVIAARLGYDIEDTNFVDGAGDRGIDFWHASEGGLYIYQVKTHELTENGKINYRTKFDSEGVKDLMRAHNFLLSSSVDNVDDRLQKLRETFSRLVRNHKSQEADNPLHIYFTLIVLGEELTEQAFTELADLESQLEKPVVFEETPIQFHVAYQNIKNILQSEWRQENNEWKDKDGNKRNYIRLSPLRQSDKRDYLNDNKSAIFYCRAIDLVHAYEDFGYQIFAPNVRANIKNSSVNAAIQESASFIRSMKEFRFLNNGLTIICTSYKLPSGQRASFEATEPGVVNGLQTVVALHRAYNALQPMQKQDFEEHCYVLIRLLRTDAVNQISDVVLATNNQNPMQPRNLMSNSSEQVYFFHYFADHLGWFYEAKQGAWEAYKKDERSWRPRLNRNAAFFKAKQGYKKLDNLDLAQDWLAFLGFADRAANERKYLFDQEKEYYELIFLRRLQNHGYDHYKTLQDALNDSDNSTPDPSTMLVAHLAHQFVDAVVPSPQANRRQALQRRGIEDRDDISPAEEAKILSEDHEYSLNQVLGTMSFVFVEFIGRMLFGLFGTDAHNCGNILLNNYSWKDLATNQDFRSAIDKAEGIDPNLAESDLLITSWLFFRESVQTLMDGTWQTSYRNARYKPRFVLNNRNQLYQEISTVNQAVQRRVPIRIWAYGIKEGEGFFGYVQRVIQNS